MIVSLFNSFMLKIKCKYVNIFLFYYNKIIDGINANNAQPDFIPSCENLIGINLIE